MIVTVQDGSDISRDYEISNYTLDGDFVTLHLINDDYFNNDYCKMVIPSHSILYMLVKK